MKMDLKKNIQMANRKARMEFKAKRKYLKIKASQI
jgi:hypothetical protein